jgi:hypothetical protein
MPSLVQCPQFWVCFACLLAVYSANAGPGTEGDAPQAHKRSILKHKKEKHGHRHEAEAEEEDEEEFEHHEGHKLKKGKGKDKKHHKPILVDVEEHEPCPEEHLEPAYHHSSEPYSVPVPVPVPVEVQVPHPVYVREPYPVYVVKVAKPRPQALTVRSRYDFLSRPHWK